MMGTSTDPVQIIRDADGHPVFAVIPFASYQELVKDTGEVKLAVPAAVENLAMVNQWSAARAWREHKELTQTEVARRMGITQGAYAQLEAKKVIRKSSREKIAKALDIDAAHLKF